MNTLLKFDPSLKYNTLYVAVTVTERETGEKIDLYDTITFHEQPIRLELLSGQFDVFRPGFPYTTYVKVSYPDGRPGVSTGDRLKVSTTYFTDKKTNVAPQMRPPQSPTANLMTFVSPFDGGDVLFLPDSYLPISTEGVVKLTLDIPEKVATASIEVQ